MSHGRDPIARPTARECARHHGWLVELAAGAIASPSERLPVRSDPAAAAHLEACEGCAEEAQQLALLSVAVRRAWDQPGAVEPPADAWERLRTRIGGAPSRRSPLAWVTSSLSGLAISAALAVGLVVPLASGAGRGPASDALRAGSSQPAANAAAPIPPEEMAERRWMYAQAAQRPAQLELAAPRAAVVPLRREQARTVEDERWDRPEIGAPSPPAVPRAVAI